MWNGWQMQLSLWFRDRHGEPTGKRFTMFINIAVNPECFWCFWWHGKEIHVPNRFSIVIKVLAEDWFPDLWKTCCVALGKGIHWACPSSDFRHRSLISLGTGIWHWRRIEAGISVLQIITGGSSLSIDPRGRQMKPVFMLKAGSHVSSLHEVEAPHSPVPLPRSRTMIFSCFKVESSIWVKQKEELKIAASSLSSRCADGGEGVRTLTQLPEPAELSEPSTEGRIMSWAKHRQRFTAPWGALALWISLLCEWCRWF